MSWHDSHTQEQDEPDEDKALREELRALMGVHGSGRREVRPVNTKASPEMIELAEALQREALRRRRFINFNPSVGATKTKMSLFLAASVLPLLLAVGGLGLWGMQQKRRADEIAAQLVTKNAEHQKLSAGNKYLQLEINGLREKALAKAKTPEKAQPAKKGVELVLPVPGNDDTGRMEERPELPDTRLVKSQ